MNRKNIRNSLIISLLLVSLVGIGLRTNVIKLPIVRYMHSAYVADFSNDRILVGFSHNVFVGKVIKQVGTKERGIGPETQFAVEVIYNVKGNLHGTVTADQQGGYEDGVLYLVDDGDVLTPNTKNGDALLQPGSTYLFEARYNKEDNWYTIAFHSVVSQDPNLGSAHLLDIAKTNERVKALQAAYPQEILLDADVKNNNTLNSYQSLQNKQ